MDFPGSDQCRPRAHDGLRDLDEGQPPVATAGRGSTLTGIGWRRRSNLIANSQAG
ncbi:hypothetical protein MLP_27980 [Microlunatus phosphovorus NM-1]|uniref:Uncharacterized protein n=1 Tax=Microlunatus phosphovorus (strain ATCC 700054 / DSM 10555 / JCM 9379 / NBRC 101784 / NCIMB 13414 / VKM Ac-1990 / NM-1) TaxID=1032480 RepID=F5XIE3_MICPN|nr:hypothetical protein MLP_27980 [Microlunatus phosphovorus NM-1]